LTGLEDDDDDYEFEDYKGEDEAGNYLDDMIKKY